MAQEQTATNTNTPAIGQTPAKPSRAELIASLDKLGDPKPANDQKPVVEAANDDAGKEPIADEQEGKNELETEPVPDEENDDDAEKADPDLQKRLAIVAKHEKRAKEREAQAKAAIEQERTAFKRERETFERERQSHAAEMESFKQLKARAKYDAYGVLKSLGITDDDLGAVTRQLWALDPKNKDRNPEAAARLMKEREQEDRVTKLERELREEREARAKEAEAKTVQAQIDSYLDTVAKAVTDEHPLAKRLMEKSAAKARIKFAEVAYSLAERDGDMPDADDVLAEYERVRREELEESGVDVASMLKQRPTAKREERTRTIGNDLGTTTPAGKSSAPKKSHLEKKAELEAELRAMDLKDR